MKRVAAILGHGCSILLLLLAAAIPDVDCCALRLFGENHHEEKEGPGEEHRARESVVHTSRRHREDTRNCHVPESHLHSNQLQFCDSRSRGQVCIADALRGDLRLRNGCGAVLLC